MKILCQGNLAHKDGIERYGRLFCRECGQPARTATPGGSFDVGFAPSLPPDPLLRLVAKAMGIRR